MTVRKKMDRIGGHYFVEIDADIRKLAENRRGKTEPRHEEIARALMSQDYSCAARYFFADLGEEEADDCDRSTRIQIFGSCRLDDPSDDCGHAGHVSPMFPHANKRGAKSIRAVHLLDVRLCSTYEAPS
jgi:hypothetical protein